MRNLLAFAWVAAVFVFAAPARADPCRLADLAWMAGVWRADEATTRSEERWTVGPGDRLMGSSWLLHTDRAGGVIESETIEADGDAVTLRIRHFSADLALAREEKDAPMVFVASDCAPKSVVLTGQGPHTGERMTYHRADAELTFIGDFLHEDKQSHQMVASSVTIRFVKARQ